MITVFALWTPFLPSGLRGAADGQRAGTLDQLRFVSAFRAAMLISVRAIGDQVIGAFAVVTTFGQLTKTALGRDVIPKLAAVETSRKFTPISQLNVTENENGSPDSSKLLLPQRSN